MCFRRKPKLVNTALRDCEAKNERLMTDNIVLRQYNNDLITLSKRLDKEWGAEVERLKDLLPRELPVLGAFVERNGAWVQSVLDSYGCKMIRHPMDSVYFVPLEEDSIKIIEWDWTDKPSYVANQRDCDKFARRLWSNSAWLFGCNHFGFVNDWSGGHAYNKFVTPDGKLYIVEPQNDKIWEYDESVMVGMYDAESGRILI